MTRESQQITTILKEHWAAYCKLAGEEAIGQAVGALARGQDPTNVAGDVADSGTPFDLKVTMEIIGEALTFLKLAFDVYKFIIEQSRAKPTPEAITNSMRQRTQDAKIIRIIVSDRGRRIIEELSRMSPIQE